MTRNRVRYWILLVDLVWISAALCCATSIRLGSSWQRTIPHHSPAETTVILMFSATIWALLYFAMDVDHVDWGSDLPGKTSLLIVAMGAFILLLVATSYVAHEYLSRAALGYFAILMFFGLVSSRRLIRWLLSSGTISGTVRRVVILGDGRLAGELAEKFDKHPELQYHVIGFLSSATEGHSGERAEVRISTLNILEFLEANRITDLMIVLLPPMPREVLSLVARCEGAGIRISLVPQPYELYISRPRLVEIGGLPLLTIGQGATSEGLQLLKAVLDRIFALLFLILSAPVLLIAALHLRMTGKNAFQRELRCGKEGAAFYMHRLNIDRNAQQVPWFESILSKTSLTELPQLWNVLRGDMSLVGPRPESPGRVKHYSEWHRQRLRVKPGITGYAQVQGLRDQHSSEEKTRLDLQYILHWSSVLDLALVLQTAWILIRRAGATLKVNGRQRAERYQQQPREV